MSGILNSAITLILAAAVAAFIPTDARADEPGSIPPDTYKVQYYDVTTADNTIHLINPLSVPRCAQFYVFDNAQTLQECCACRVGPNGFATLSVRTDLTSNPSHGAGPPTKGLIEMMTTAPNSGDKCIVNSAPLNPAEANLAPLLRAWIKHGSPGSLRGSEDVSEERFDDVPLVEGQEDALETLCAAAVAGSFGTCTCGNNN